MIINRQPLPWADWASEFRSKMPTEIRSMMEEISPNAETKDHKQSIRERLKPLRDLFKLSRYRPADDGEVTTDPESRTTPSVAMVRPMAAPAASAYQGLAARRRGGPLTAAPGRQSPSRA